MPFSLWYHTFYDNLYHFSTDLSALADGTVTGAVKAAMERAEKSLLWGETKQIQIFNDTLNKLVSGQIAPWSGVAVSTPCYYATVTVPNIPIYSVIPRLYEWIIEIQKQMKAGDIAETWVNCYQRNSNDQLLAMASESELIYESQTAVSAPYSSVTQYAPIMPGTAWFVWECYDLTSQKYIIPTSDFIKVMPIFARVPM